MAFGNTQPSDANIVQNAPEIDEDFNSFLYFRDLLASADMSILALKLMHQHLVYPNLPKSASMTLNMIPETQQLIAMLPDLLIKVNDLRTLCEGGLMAAASTELANHSLAMMKTS